MGWITRKGVAQWKAAQGAVNDDDPFIKLDAASVIGDNTELVLTDVKTKMAIWSEETQNKARGDAWEAAKCIEAKPGYKNSLSVQN